MNVMIIGGTRYLGPEIKKCLANNARVEKIATLSRSPVKIDGNHHFICDRKIVEELGAAIGKFAPDIIIDTVNYCAEDAAGMLRLEQQGILENVKHYIVLSSFFVYRYLPETTFSEQPILELPDLNKCPDRYTVGKVEMEHAISNSYLMSKTSIIRLPFIFSWDDYTGRFQSVCNSLIKRNPANKGNRYNFSMIRKKFAASCIMEITSQPAQGIINAANQGFVNIWTMANLIGSSRKHFKLTARGNSCKNPYELDLDLKTQTKKIKIKESVTSGILKEANKFFTRCLN